MKKSFLFGIIILSLVFVTQNINAKENNKTIDIIYFHATIRCQTCLTIEDFINKSVQMSFKNELEDSTMTLKSIDFLQPENEHFQEKYDFDFQTLIISKKVNGNEIKWKNLDRIWDYTNDFEKFKKYIITEIKKLLGV